MNVTVDTDKLVAYGLSIDDVRQALVRQNLEVPGGRVDQGPRELVLRTLGRLNTAEEFNDLIVANRGGYPVRIKDIGQAEDSIEEPRSLARLDGQNAVSVVVQKQSGTNVVQVDRRRQGPAGHDHRHAAAGREDRGHPRPVAVRRRSRSKRSSSTCCWPPCWSRSPSCCSSATGGPR